MDSDFYQNIIAWSQLHFGLILYSGYRPCAWAILNTYIYICVCVCVCVYMYLWYNSVNVYNINLNSLRPQFSSSHSDPDKIDAAQSFVLNHLIKVTLLHWKNYYWHWFSFSSTCTSSDSDVVGNSRLCGREAKYLHSEAMKQ